MRIHAHHNHYIAIRRIAAPSLRWDSLPTISTLISIVKQRPLNREDRSPCTASRVIVPGSLKKVMSANAGSRGGARIRDATR